MRPANRAWSRRAGSQAAPCRSRSMRSVVVLVAPVVEELTFRGLGFSLLSRYGSLIALVVTSAAFAAAHGLVNGFAALFLFGAAVAFLRLWTDSLYPGMLLHADFQRPRARRGVRHQLVHYVPSVRRAAIFVAAMAFAPAAHAAPPAVSVQVSPGSGAAPLQVTLTASGDLALYHWDLGDGAAADGPSSSTRTPREGSPRGSPPPTRSARPPRRPPRSPRSGSRSARRASGATSRSSRFHGRSSRH